jgi:hypothetical protein
MRRWAVIGILMTLAILAGASDDAPEAELVAPAPNGIEQPLGYLDWRVISASSRSDNGTIRVILGNEVAVAAAQAEETRPWPDGSILCKLVWKQVEHPGWPSAGVPGEFVHSEFMIKDSEQYELTGGWGFARWLGLGQVPFGSDESFANNCFGCHVPMAEQDYVFTHPAAVPDGTALVPN